MQLDISHNLKNALASLNDIQKTQVPFALASTLTKTARDAEKAVTLHIGNVTEGGPTPYTRQAVGTKVAKKNNLESRVFIKYIQAQYLTWQVHGGVRRPKDKVEVVPFDKNFRLNKYGNIPGRHAGSIGRWMKKQNMFVGTVKGIEGIWQRYKDKKRHPKLLMAFEGQVTYKKKIRFYETVIKIVNRVVVGHFKTQMAIAMATRRHK